MKKIFFTCFALIAMLAAFTITTQAATPDELAQQAATKAAQGAPITPEEIIARVEKAAALVKAKGKNAMDAFRGNSEFVGNGTYVWVHNLDGIMIMHPMKNKLDGKQVFGVKDPNGKRLFSAMNTLCKASGAGWVDYMWAKPGSNTPVPKISYVKLVESDDQYVVGCGMYCDRETADRLLATNK